MNIITDLEGNFESMLALLKQMPEGEEVVCCGDAVDRGPRSKETLEWLRKNATLLLGNHEHMMIDAYRNGGYYESDIWIGWNGGIHTAMSFVQSEEKLGSWREFIPEDLIQWIEGCPKYIQREGLLVTHAPKFCRATLEETCDFGSGATDRKCDRSLIWNRSYARKIDGVFQVHGHNRGSEAMWFSEEFQNGVRASSPQAPGKDPYAICIDSGSTKTLTGLHWPSMKLYVQPRIDKIPLYV